MKNVSFCALFLAGTAVFGAELLLDGGKLVPVDSTMVESHCDHLNFCFATRFSDGSIHLNHSKGVHTVTETQCSEYSTDGGHTWHSGKGKAVFGINSFETRAGKKMQIGCWDFKQTRDHEMVINRLGKDGKLIRKKQTLTLPYPSSVHTHRSVLRLKNGELLASAYGIKAGQAKLHVFLIGSSDDGESWHFVADVASDPEKKTPEGPGEATFVQLADGRIFGAWRDAATLKYAYSKDNGKTWGDFSEYKDLPLAVSPHALLTSDGTLIVVTGRPNLYALIDFTGTGKHFQKQILYRGSGSSYGSILETRPGELLILHDESDFRGEQSATPFSRIMADRYRLVKDPSIRKSSGDPRAKGFTAFYSPFAGRDPIQERIAVAYNYQKLSDPKKLAYYQVVRIPERPYPVLRIVQRGDGKIIPASQWCTFRSGRLPESVKKLRIEFECRLMDPSLKSPQFMVSGQLASPEGGNKTLSGSVFLSNTGVMLCGATVLKEDLSHGFHAFVLEIDTTAGKARLYRKGNAKPVAEKSLNKGPQEGPQVRWGDGSGQVFGDVDLSYIGWTFEK